MSKVRVLLADDHKQMLEYVRSFLSAESCEVIGSVSDGQAVVDAAKKLLPDVVVLDVSMPVFNGIEAARRLRAADPSIKIVFLTVDNDPDTCRVALDTGACGYVLKPRLATDLIPAIELALSRFSEVRALEREVETLSDRLETRKLVERAKGLLQANQGMTEPEAFKWIQRAAMDRRTTMKHVAEVVLETLDTPDDA